MTSGGVLGALLLLGLAWLAVFTVITARRGGRGPGEPPASHSRVDPAGFFVLPEPRSAFPTQRTAPRLHRRPVAATAAAGRTARKSRTARRRSPADGGRPPPSDGRVSTRLS